MADKPTTSKKAIIALAVMIGTAAGPLDRVLGSPTFVVGSGHKVTLVDGSGRTKEALIEGFDECPERWAGNRCVVIRPHDTFVNVRIVSSDDSAVEMLAVRRTPSRPGFIALERPDHSILMASELAAYGASND